MILETERNVPKPKLLEVLPQNSQGWFLLVIGGMGGDEAIGGRGREIHT